MDCEVGACGFVLSLIGLRGLRYIDGLCVPIWIGLFCI